MVLVSGFICFNLSLGDRNCRVIYIIIVFNDKIVFLEIVFVIVVKLFILCSYDGFFCVGLDCDFKLVFLMLLE